MVHLWQQQQHAESAKVDMFSLTKTRQNVNPGDLCEIMIFLQYEKYVMAQKNLKTLYVSGCAVSEV